MIFEFGISPIYNKYINKQVKFVHIDDTDNLIMKFLIYCKKITTLYIRQDKIGGN